MTLTPVVQNHHVEEAIRLFKFSTMDAVSAGSADGRSRGELNEEMTRIERELRRRLPVGWSTSYQSLIREFVTQQGYSSHALERTLFVLEKREVIRFSGQVRLLVHLFCPLCSHLRSIEKGCASRRCLVLPELFCMCCLCNCNMCEACLVLVI
jgi:DNA replication licensing factor MCM5